MVESDHEHDAEGHCIPKPEHEEMANTLGLITVGLTSVMDVITEFPVGVCLWSERLFEDMQAVMRERMMQGDIQAAFLEPMTALKIALYTGYRAALGGQTIPDPIRRG